MENSLSQLVNIFSQKFSTTFVVQSKKSEINFKLKKTLILNPNFNYELALVYFSTFNSIFNINENNNRISIMFPGKTIEIKLPSGAYEITEISKAIESRLKHEKDIPKLKDKEYFIEIRPNPISVNCIMELTNGCKVRFPKENSLADMLGFEVEKIYNEGQHFSKPVNISEINRIMIGCNIIEGAYRNGERTNILYDFPANTVLRGRRIIERPNFPVYYPVLRKEIDEINFKIFDDNEKLIDFNGEEICFTIHLKQV